MWLPSACIKKAASKEICQHPGKDNYQTRVDGTHASLQTNSGVGTKHEPFAEQKVSAVIGKEKHVVSEIPQQLSVKRGNGKIDMFGLIDGLNNTGVCWS